MSSHNNSMLLYEKIIEYSTKFWEQVFLGFQGKNHLFQRKSGCSHFCSSIPCKSRDFSNKISGNSFPRKTTRFRHVFPIFDCQATKFPATLFARFGRQFRHVPRFPKVCENMFCLSTHRIS